MRAYHHIDGDLNNNHPDNLRLMDVRGGILINLDRHEAILSHDGLHETIRELREQRDALLEACRIAKKFMDIASDWNLDECEIDGEMKSTYDWIEVIDAAVKKAKG